MNEMDYTSGDATVGFTSSLTISHNVGGMVVAALIFLVVLRLALQKHMI